MPRLGTVRIAALFTISLSAAFLLVSLAQQPSLEVTSPTYHIEASAPTLAPATSYAIFDVATGEVLVAENATTARPIASLTKLMTAHVAERELPLEATTTITATDVATYGRAGKLAVNEEYRLRELLMALLLESSNDAAAALERASGLTLVAEMNDAARAYGLTATRFADASGLSSGNVSTALDLATLARRLYAEDPYVLDVTRLSQYLAPGNGWINNNPVRDTPAYRGGKHGYTDAAGRTIVALFDEPFAGGTRTLGYVVLGSDDLTRDVATLRTFVATGVDWR